MYVTSENKTMIKRLIRIIEIEFDNIFVIGRKDGKRL